MLKKLSLMGLLVTAFVGTTAYGMDEKDDRRSIVHAQPSEWDQWEPTEEELVRLVAQYEKNEAEATAAAKAKQAEEDEWAVAMRAAKEADEQEEAEAAARLRAQQAERDYRVAGTNLGKDFLADANVQSTLNTPEARNFLAFFGTSPERLKDKSAKSQRHRQEEEANAQKYGPQYCLKNRSIEKLIAQGKLVRK